MSTWEDNPSESAEVGGPKRSAYVVTGMTCVHCVSSVTEEVGAIDGVRDIVVDLRSGALTFESETPVPREAVEAAVCEAGYALA